MALVSGQDWIKIFDLLVMALISNINGNSCTKIMRGVVCLVYIIQILT